MRISDWSSDVCSSDLLIELLHAILSPYEADQGHVVEIEGDDIPVHGSRLTSLALVFHEFATNAAKYGALSAADGRLSIKLERQGEHLLLNWIERGGPPVTGSPDHAGFCRTPIGSASVREIGGKYEYMS